MAATETISILLADEDALRREGLAAVITGSSNCKVVALCADGTEALEAIRRLRPEVAIVDLNLPAVHGIELVRRVRSEALGTKVVILASTADEEIIREVVRAGADAYLLKNGPSRHLIDAISYVRDGGQYFSPQLRRDGRDRHLLEETPRPPAKPARPVPPRAAPPVEDFDDVDEEEDIEEPEEAPPPPRRAPPRRSSRRLPVRERIRQEARSENLKERDYEILDMMAEGIKPILDRLEDIEGRIGGMETGDEPVPSDLRGWLNGQIAETLRDPRSGMSAPSNRSLQDLESKLPGMIEAAVTSRFHNMAEKLQKEIEETHVRTLETFVKNIQVKLVQRVAALETDMTRQADAMKELREYSERTEDNLTRLITGVDKLAQDLPRRLLQAPANAEAGGSGAPQSSSAHSSKSTRRKVSKNFGPRLFWGVAALAVIIFAGSMLFRGSSPKSAAAVTAPGAAAGGAAPTPAAPALQKPNSNADTKTKMAAAQQYSDQKDYSMAEDIYKQVLASEPNNVDAMKALASVLYREDKIEESAAILEKLPKN